MKRRDIELDLINSIIEQIIEDVNDESYEPLEELFRLVLNEGNFKYFIAYLSNEELANKYNNLL